MDDFNTETVEELHSETLDDIAEPPMYRVLLHNDDYTTMQFVVELLIVVFNKHMEEAVHIMLHVHNSGIGVCGIYPGEVAETKVETVHELARERGFPLKCTMEKE
jgi:ATP-dependent Clp protease adaptor protein ClpS